MPDEDLTPAEQDQLMAEMVEAGLMPGAVPPPADPGQVAASGGRPVRARPSNPATAERDRVIGRAIAAGKFHEGRRAFWAAQYDRDPEATRAMIAMLASGTPDARHIAAAGRSAPVRAATTGQAIDQAMHGLGAASTRPAPRLFGASDLPVTTRSGVDPKVLESVPWQARPTLARAETAGEVHEIVSLYQGFTTQEEAEVYAASQAESFGPYHGDVQEYAHRLEQWYTGADLPLSERLDPLTSAARNSLGATDPTGVAASASDDAAYNAALAELGERGLWTHLLKPRPEPVRAARLDPVEEARRRRTGF